MNNKILNKLGSGSAGDAYLMEDGRAIIIGKREDSFSTYQSLFDKMQIVDGKISTIKYPQIYQLIEPCEDFPYGAMIEEYISGKELREKVGDLTTSQKRDVGATLSGFLKQLHAIQSDGNKEEEIKINLAKYERSLGIIKDYLALDIYQKLVEIKADYKHMIENKDFCITHGDLNAGNIMIGEDGKMSGIIDFGNMEYYIPEIEFVHMYFFDRDIYQAMVDGYDKQIDETEIILLELIVNVRHFKNIVKFDDKRENCLNNIKELLELYDEAIKRFNLV